MRIRAGVFAEAILHRLLSTAATGARITLILAFATGLHGCAATHPPTGVMRLIRSKWPYRSQVEIEYADKLLSRAGGQELISKIEAKAGPLNLLQKHLAFEQAISGVPLTIGNKVALLENGPATYKAMLAAIRDATDSIDLEIYIFSDDVEGRKFADALIARQRAGVQVNVIYDSFGSLGTPESFFDRMKASGINVLQFNPIDPLRARLRWTVDHRDHRKLMILDGRVAFLGGINISAVYGPASKAQVPDGSHQFWRDTDVQITGPAVAQCQALFMDTWRDQRGPALRGRKYFPPLQRQGDDIVRVIGSVPERFSLIYATLVSAIDNAERNVWIADAYFAPEPDLIRVLEQAARRGVDVRLLFPFDPDEPLIQSAARSYYSELMRAGVKIYEWHKGMMHAKTATLDDVWSTVGSSNLDSWSIVHNNEVNAVVLSESFGSAMDTMFLSDIEQSDRIDREQWQKRGLLERLDETIARIAQPLL
jgi:cardiolipin synthase A/B